MTKKEKIKKILSSKELLKVESVNAKIPKYVRNVLIIIISIGYILALQLYRNQEIYWTWFFALSFFYGLIMAVIYRIIHGKGNPLLITEMGIVISPFLAELWEDIESYGWETFKGLTKVSFSSKREGVCLYLINKGGPLRQRNIENWTGHTMLPQYGIFFTYDQVRETEEIFQKYGIKKEIREVAK